MSIELALGQAQPSRIVLRLFFRLLRAPGKNHNPELYPAGVVPALVLSLGP
jgi:hypothetical protein